MSSFSIPVVADEAELLQVTGTKNLAVLYFFASWDETSDSGTQMASVFEALSTRYGTTIVFVKIEAESSPLLSEKYKIAVVPTFITLQSGKVITRLEGANPPDLNKMVKSLSDMPIVKAASGVCSACPTVVPFIHVPVAVYLVLHVCESETRQTLIISLQGHSVKTSRESHSRATSISSFPPLHERHS